jgi:processive 1,2-diacylglycerol beta-glucosyltransferase
MLRIYTPLSKRVMQSRGYYFNRESYSFVWGKFQVEGGYASIHWRDAFPLKNKPRCVLSKFIGFCCCLFVFATSSGLFSEELVEVLPKRKTILILSSTGGGGHIAAANTLQSLVGEEYDLKMVYPINQLRIWGVPSCEQFYNMMLRKSWIRSMNFIVRHLAPPIFRSRLGKIEKIISSYINTYDPDLIISLIPFVNYPASEAARKKEIPYLLVTTDNDLRNWAFELERLKHPQFKVTIGSDLPTTRDVLLKKNIPESAIETIGLPLRPDFIAQKDQEKLREEFSLPQDKAIILIMMGGAGSETAYEYTKKIGEMDLGAHLIVIAGRNKKLKKELEEVKLHPSNSLTVFGFTDRVSDIMAVSDVIITKPGPGTINEAIAMKLPILIDNTDISLFWERANVDMVMKYGVGQRIREFSQVKNLLTAYLKDSRTKELVEQSYVSAPSNQFHLRILGIIEEMIALREQSLSESSVATIQEFDTQEFLTTPLNSVD